MEQHDAHRQAIVDMVNILGAPRPCPCQSCDGCSYEQVEAASEGLRALGYLAENTYRLEKVTTKADGSECRHFEFDGPQPDPLEAWERFMRDEFGHELPEGWRGA